MSLRTWVVLFGLLLTSSTRADEIILDPELDAGGAASTDEVIQDPELGGPGTGAIADPELGDDGTAAGSALGAISMDAPPPAPVYPPEFRAILHTRLGRDLVVTGTREEVWENQNLAQLELKVRTDSHSRVAMGLRLLYWLAALEQPVQDVDAARYDLDLVPVNGYWDRTVSPGVHVRVGYQDIHLGRFDAAGGLDVLSVFDLRDGPSTLPDAARVGQLALRLDADFSAAFGLQAYWVPFFTGHLFRSYESDYAVVSASNYNAQRELDAFFRTVAIAFSGDNAAVLTAQQQAQQDEALAELRRKISRSARDRLAYAGVDAFAPEPDLTTSQVALRAVHHGSSGEIAFTAATALEKVPALHQRSLTAVQGEANPQLAVWLDYPRYYVLGLDGAAALGPLQLGGELSLQLGRVYYYTDFGGRELQLFRGTAAQVALRAEYLASADLVLVVEGNVARMVTLPERSRIGVDGQHDGVWQFATLGIGRYTVGRLGLELSAGLMTGTTFLLAPRLSWKLGGGAELEIGAQFFGRIMDSVIGGISVGKTYEGVDQGFVGLRWGPSL